PPLWWRRPRAWAWHGPGESRAPRRDPHDVAGPELLPDHGRWLRRCVAGSARHAPAARPHHATRARPFRVRGARGPGAASPRATLGFRNTGHKETPPAGDALRRRLGVDAETTQCRRNAILGWAGFSPVSGEFSAHP